MRAILLSLAALILLTACQKREEPVPLPTQDQWRRMQENVTTTPPEGLPPVGAIFGDDEGPAFELVGWTVDPETVEVGESMTIDFYWRVLAERSERWTVFVHLDNAGQRQNLDHEAMGGTLPTSAWKVGQIIRDSVTADLVNTMPPGDVEIWMGFWNSNTDARMSIVDAGTGSIDDTGRLLAGRFPAQWNAPTLEIRRATAPINIDGRGTDRPWTRAQRTPAWTDTVAGESVEGGDAWAKLLWDDEYLYVLMHARDPDIWGTITERDGNLWEEEVLEFYVDAAMNGRDYLELQINPLGTVFDAVFRQPTGRDLPRARAQNLDGLESAVHVSGTTDDRDDVDRTWTAELAIPLASLPSIGELPPTEGREIRVNFYRYNRPDGDERPITSGWSVVGPGSFHNPPRFGIATFRGDSGAGATGRPPSEQPTGDSAAGEGTRDQAAAQTPERTRRRILQGPDPSGTPNSPARLRPGTSTRPRVDQINE
jgi:hypothetical protein